MVLVIVVCKSWKSIGLVTKSNAPLFMAVRIFLMPLGECHFADTLANAGA
jgi:hypothetical protein